MPLALRSVPRMVIWFQLSPVGPGMPAWFSRRAMVNGLSPAA